MQKLTVSNQEVRQEDTRPHTSLKMRHLYERIRLTRQTTTPASDPTLDPSYLEHKCFVTAVYIYIVIAINYKGYLSHL